MSPPTQVQVNSTLPQLLRFVDAELRLQCFRCNQCAVRRGFGVCIKATSGRGRETRETLSRALVGLAGVEVFLYWKLCAVLVH